MMPRRPVPPHRRPPASGGLRAAAAGPGLLAALLLTLCTAIRPQGAAALQDPAAVLDSLVAAEQADSGAAPDESVILPPDAARLPSGPAALAYADADALAAYADWGLEHRVRVFEWQYQSSRIIFFAVLFLVLCGVVFSGIQFWRAMQETAVRARSEGTGAEPGPAEVPVPGTTSHLEISTGGLKISSPVLGVIILGLSLAFFYLYLIYVYPIGETF